MQDEPGDARAEAPADALGDAGASRPQLTPVQVNLPLIVSVGTAAWLVALLLTLLVPSLHRGPHHWWPWAALCGVLLGLVGLGYVHRGRGNIAQL